MDDGLLSPEGSLDAGDDEIAGKRDLPVVGEAGPDKPAEPIGRKRPEYRGRAARTPIPRPGAKRWVSVTANRRGRRRSLALPHDPNVVQAEARDGRGLVPH